MAPRSSIDRDEHSMGWDSTSTEIKDSTNTNHKPDLATASESLPVRTVRFAPTAKVRQVAKFTKEQAKDIWFVNEDFAKMKRSFAPTVQRMMNGSLTEEDEQGEEHCIRGLEYRTKDGARRRMKNKFNGMAAVLHEQDRQVFEEAEDPEQLSKVYQEVNAHCMHEAMLLGKQDEFEIKAYLESDNEPFYDATEDGALSKGGRLSPKSHSKLKHSGSFSERSIRGFSKGLKRVFSGKMNRRTVNSAVPAV